MKYFMYVALFLTISNVGLAKGLDTKDNAKALNEKIIGTTMLMKDVNGIGISGCDPQTGALSDFKSDFVHCVSLSTETMEAAQALQVLFPEGQKVDGVFIAVKAIGKLRPSP